MIMISITLVSSMKVTVALPQAAARALGAKDAKWLNDVTWRNTFGGANMNNSYANLGEFVTLGALDFGNENDPYVCDDGLLGLGIRVGSHYLLFNSGSDGDGGDGGSNDGGATWDGGEVNSGSGGATWSGGTQ